MLLNEVPHFFVPSPVQQDRRASPGLSTQGQNRKMRKEERKGLTTLVLKKQVSPAGLDTGPELGEQARQGSGHSPWRVHRERGLPASVFFLFPISSAPVRFSALRMEDVRSIG